MRHFIGLLSVVLVVCAGTYSCTIVAFINPGCFKETAQEVVS